MKSKIVTIEDVTKIVGISNYVKALNLKKEKLKYDHYEALGTRAKVYFYYEETEIKIVINQKYSMIDMNCSCNPGIEYCPHIALAVMHLIEHEDIVNQIMEQLNHTYDADFNQKLFALKQTEKKKLVQLDINLKQIDYRNPDEYELQVKIGCDKKYTLKKQLDSFFNVYCMEDGEVFFGQNFTYNFKQHYFNEVDTKILEYIHQYIDSQNNLYRDFYGYHNVNQSISMIRLTGATLRAFMRLLQKKPFTVEIGYYICSLSGIVENFPYLMELEATKEQLKWKIHRKEVRPFLSTYEYVILEDTMYHVSSHSLLKLLAENKKEEVIFPKQEWETFARKILPDLPITQLTMDPMSRQIFPNEQATVKYYFKKEKENIVSEIRLCYGEVEIDLFDETNEWNGHYLKRESKQEEKYQMVLESHGFVKYETEYRLEQQNNIIQFLEVGIHELSKQYEVYVASDLKNMRILKQPKVRSMFSLGRDNILSYQFEVEHVDPVDLMALLVAVRERKKYYKLKSGDYLNLEDDTLNHLVELTDSLQLKQEEDSYTIPLYQALSLSQYQQYEFIEKNDTLDHFIDQFETYKNIEIQFDPSDRTILREYQITGIKWMTTISKCGFGGILADEMGLGKSLQTIMYMKYKLKEGNQKFLLVVPTSLVYNWEKEFQVFGSHIRYAIMNESKEKRIQLLKNIEEYDVYIITYGILRQDIEEIQDIHFDTCIIDEAQNIKNAHAETTISVKKIKAKTKFALTGTPIENSIIELWSIFDFLMHGFFPNLKKFKQIYQVKSEEKKSFQHLNEQISPFLLRRKKKDVLKELPDKIETNLLIEMSEEQKHLYMAQLEKTKKEISEIQSKDRFEKSQILILSLLTKLRQICIDPRLVVEENIRSGKINTLIDLLIESIQNGHKILLFSQFPSALRLLKNELDENRITSYYLDGKTKSKTRMELVDAFNQDTTNVFLISLKAGGTGLNLTSADVVIHLDPWWNPQVENQATDRSHRIGQTNAVEVIKLIAKGTIEEKIIELQERKKELSNQVIEGKNRDQIVISKLTEEELRKLLQ